jgi:DNA repair photolyase
MNRMFDFGDGPLKTWNPVRVKYCPNDCYAHDGEPGCWANVLRKGRFSRVYDNASSEPAVLTDKHENFWKYSYIFVGSFCDMFHPTISDDALRQVMDEVRKYNGVILRSTECDVKWQQFIPQFLLCTKNPQRYVALMLKYGDDFFPANVIFGITVESNRDYPNVSKAPELQTHRLMVAQILSETGVRVFLSIEPILDFDMMQFVRAVRLIKPWAVAVGFDNYGNHLPEPTTEEVMQLVSELERIHTTKVYRKSLRGGDQHE